MRIGLDFDNTIACYDGVFHRVAVDAGLIAPDVGTDKTSVRDHLRRQGREDEWTRLQGEVYGARMELVAVYSGLLDFVRAARRQGHLVSIISHKTRHPFIGARHDLHEAAHGFLRARGVVDEPGGMIAARDVHFELTLAAKLARIAAESCDVFVDDLPELLAEPAFPPATRRVLFDPRGHYPGGAWRDRRFERHAEWPTIEAALLAPGNR